MAKNDGKSNRDYEEYLNEFYAEQYDGDWEGVKNEFGQYHNSEKILWNNYNRRTLGSFLRRYSPVTFYAGYSDWVNKPVTNGTT